jgi:D-glycero-alpha-D-manno-heptose 1-phosphate guanylyltransferase
MKNIEISLLVLAGGLGSRLRPVTGEIPKALVGVHGVPFLQYQLKHWVSQGVKSFVFLLHYQSDLVVEYLTSLSDNLLKYCEVRCVKEPFLMGTGGAVANALRELKIDGEFILTNADTWLTFGIKTISKGRAPLIGIVKVDDSGRYGSVELEADGRVKKFSEKGMNSIQSGWINSGTCKLHSHMFEKWLKFPFSLEKDFFPELVKNRILFAKPINSSDFIDIGIPEDYFTFCNQVKYKKLIHLNGKN